MAKTDYVFTSESVSEGHPDKVSDRISDAIVDLYLKADPYARVALETLCTTNRIVLAGEVRGPASVTVDKMVAAARDAVKDIGYEQEGFHWKTAQVDCLVHAQSADIAVGVDQEVLAKRLRSVDDLPGGMVLDGQPAIGRIVDHFVKRLGERIVRRNVRHSGFFRAARQRDAQHQTQPTQ